MAHSVGAKIRKDVKKELIAYAIEHIKSVLPGLSSRPVPPLPKGVKVNLSCVIGALLQYLNHIISNFTNLDLVNFAF